MRQRLKWTDGAWTRPPAEVVLDGDDMVVTAEEGSDFWRETSYGFVHDNGHGLLVDLDDRQAIEATFMCDYDQQFDHAGVLVMSDERNWVKAAVEYADGAPQLGAVVTREVSDWSLSPVPHWAGHAVTVRVSRDGNALTVRARAGDEERLVRVAPLDPRRTWRAGPLVNAPLRSGLTVRFTGLHRDDADQGLHP